MDTNEFAAWRDSIKRQARELVQETPVQFEHAGQRLDELFSAERIEAECNEGDEAGVKDAVHQTPQSVLFMRLSAALGVIRNPGSYPYNNHLDFQRSDESEERRLAARLTILVMLAAADPDKSEAVTEAMGEIATIPYTVSEIVEGKKELAFGGSDWIPWAEDGWEEQNEPSPKLLKHLEHAIRVARHGSSDAAHTSKIPTGDGRPCDQKGKNRFDECDRALRDVGRYVAHFHHCVNHWHQEWEYRFDERGRRTLDEIKIDNRTWWSKWSGVIARARDAIVAIERPELMNVKQAAFDGLAIVADQYQEPLMYHNYEEPGDHLFRKAHQRQANPREVERIEKLVRALDDLDPLRRGCLLHFDEPEPTQETPTNTNQPQKLESQSETRATSTASQSNGVGQSDQVVELVELQPKRMRKGRRRSAEEIARHNRELTIFLLENPGGTKEQAAKLLGVSVGTIYNSRPWKMRQALRRENSNESRPTNFENLDALSDPKSAQIRDSSGALPRDASRIAASNIR